MKSGHHSYSAVAANKLIHQASVSFLLAFILRILFGTKLVRYQQILINQNETLSFLEKGLQCLAATLVYELGHVSCWNRDLEALDSFEFRLCV